MVLHTFTNGASILMGKHAGTLFVDVPRSRDMEIMMQTSAMVHDYVRSFGIGSFTINHSFGVCARGRYPIAVRLAFPDDIELMAPRDQSAKSVAPARTERENERRPGARAAKAPVIVAEEPRDGPVSEDDDTPVGDRSWADIVCGT